MHTTNKTPARPWAKTRTLTGARVIAFDIDNTIVDIRSTKRRAYRDAFQKLQRYGLPGDASNLADRMLKNARRRGIDAPDLAKTFLYEELGLRDERLAQEAQRLLERFEPARVELFEGVIETLDQLRNRGYRLYAVTDAPLAATHRRLGSNGLTGRFDGIITREDTPRGKATPAPYRHVLEKANIVPGELLSVGDHPVRDVSHAISLGGQGVLAAYGHRPAHDPSSAPHPPTATIGSLRELLALLPSCSQAQAPRVAFA